MLGKFIRALLRPIAAQYWLFVALLLRNTGSGYGYVLGLAPLRAYASAFGAPISAKYGALFSCLATDKLGLRYR